MARQLEGVAEERLSGADWRMKNKIGSSEVGKVVAIN